MGHYYEDLIRQAGSKPEYDEDLLKQAGEQAEQAVSKPEFGLLEELSKPSKPEASRASQSKPEASRASRGGLARAAKLTPERRREIAQHARRTQLERAARKQPLGFVHNFQHD